MSFLISHNNYLACKAIILFVLYPLNIHFIFYCSEQEAAIIENAYSQINSLTLEMERAKNRELENQIAQFNENLEETVTQLDETGRQLDIATSDVRER